MTVTGQQEDPTASLRRQLTWDLLPCPQANEFMPKVSLVPSSEEGLEIEHRASHRRMQEVIPILLPMVQTADLAGAILGRRMLDIENPDGDYTDEQATQAIQKLSEISRVCTVVVVANLIEAGLLHLPHYAEDH